MLRISRLFFILSWLGLATAAQAQHNDVINLQLRWHHQFQFAGYYAAVEKGYYKDEGLEVVLHAGTPNRQPVSVVLGGRAQYGEGNSEVLFQKLQGAPLVALAAIFQHSPSVLLVRKDSGIDSVHGLAGKKVMLMNVTEDADFLTMFLNEGVWLSQINIIPSSYDINDLITGKVEAFNSYLTNEPYYLKQQNIAYNIINPSNYRVDFYSDILFTTEAEQAEHPERVKAMRRASLKGWTYAMDHPGEIIDLLLNKYDVKKSREHLEFEADEMRKLILPDLIEIGHMNPDRWRHMADTFVNAGLIQPNYSLDTFIYKTAPKNLPKWVVPSLIGAMTIIFGVFAVTCYLLGLNRRLAKAETGLRTANNQLSEELNERKMIEETLQRNEMRHRSLFQNMLSGFAYCKILYQFKKPHDFIYLEVNPAFEEVTGLRKVIGKRASDAIPQIQTLCPELIHIFGRVVAGGDPEKFEIYIAPLNAWFSVSAYHTEKEYFVALFDNITERRLLQQQQERLANLDDLTSLPNRRCFMTQASAEFARILRYHKELSLLMLDLDHFKKINDTYGHPVGDLVLQKLSEVCRPNLRNVDIMGRLGGEEFAILLPETGEQEALEAAERLREHIDNAKVILENGQKIQFTASIGVATYNKSCADVEALINQADQALYRAKQSGRNRVFADNTTTL